MSNWGPKIRFSWISNFSRGLAVAFAGAIFAANSIPVSAQVKPASGLMRFPDVSAEQIVFSYGDDLWLVNRVGGLATPLASPAGAERNARFSPDGKSIAFEAAYDGARDLYVIPTAGGQAKRMTFHPASESLCDWTPDGEALLFSSNGFSGLGRMTQLLTISEKQPLSTLLPVPYGSNGSISADGKWLAYTPHSHDNRTWKRYRGGMASDIWLFHLEAKTAKQITDYEGTDSLPMWHEKILYYLSDAGAAHRLNIWSYNSETEERREITKFEAFDCKWPAIGPGPDGRGEIVFQNGAALYLLNLTSGESQAVSITVPGDRPLLRPQKIDAAKFIKGGDVSPTGKRIVVQARGDIWTAPVENGSPRNLTVTSGAFERDPAWSPDGRWIAYLSDATGEYELYAIQSDGRGETKQLTKNGSAFRFAPSWSPDSKHIVFTDKTGAALLYSFDSGETRKIATDPQDNRIAVSWSHNSQWITYALSSKSTAEGSAIWAYQIENGAQQKLTSGFFYDSSPIFDNLGEQLFFRSNRAFNRPQYEDVGTSFVYSGTEVLMVLPLRADVKHPFLPKLDEEEWEDEKAKAEKDEKNPAANDNEKNSANDEEKADNATEDIKPAAKPTDAGSQDADSNHSSETQDGKPDDVPADEKSDSKSDADKPQADKSKPFEIEFDGAEQRSFAIPVEQGNFGSIAVNHENQLIYARQAPRGDEAPSSIKLFDLTDKENKEKEVVAEAAGFGISADQKKLVVFQVDKIYVIDAKVEQKLDKPISTEGMSVVISPREEWKQIFHDAWRMERDFFYDPAMHGVDWEAVREQYATMLDDCVSRRDLSFIISEMISELNVGHAYYQEAELEDGPAADSGVLGCRLQVAEGAYQIAEIYAGAAWDYDARNPLSQAGVKTGQYLLAINDQPLTIQENPDARLVGLAGATITVTVSEDTKLDDQDRRVTLKLESSDEALRFRNWIEQNRQQVAEKTAGKVGYVYVVNTGVPGQNDLFRQFYGQAGKEALIIDDRWNGGGQIPTRFIELLNRPVTNYWARRDAVNWTWPPDSHQGPKCMLINGMAGSGGDMLPALFRQAGLGKLIGMRTWGGLVGISGSPELIDGAAVTVPSFAYYETDGTWGIEGHGVEPDIKVIDDPEKMVSGGDPQLDSAIQLMLDEIKTRGYQAPARPPYPDRSKFGIEPADK